jgi:F-type H+-transporting ATPase subunit alpha
VDVLGQYEQQLYSFLESKYIEILKEIKEQKTISEDLDNRMKAAFTEFDSVFQATVGAAAA